MTTVISPEYLAKSGTEHGEQTALFCWAGMAMRRGFTIANNMISYMPENQEMVLRDAWAYPDLRWLYAIPNGGGRTMSQGAMLKAEGVKGGVADVHWPVPKWDHHGLYIEMKKANGSPSNVAPEQYDFGAFVTLKGSAWYVAFGWQQAAALIEWYLNDPRIMPTLSDNQTKVHNKMMEIANGR